MPPSTSWSPVYPGSRAGRFSGFAEGDESAVDCGGVAVVGFLEGEDDIDAADEVQEGVDVARAVASALQGIAKGVELAGAGGVWGTTGSLQAGDKRGDVGNWAGTGSSGKGGEQDAKVIEEHCGAGEGVWLGCRSCGRRGDRFLTDELVGGEGERGGRGGGRGCEGQSGGVHVGGGD